LSLESVDNIKRSDSLSLGVLSVGDSVTDDRLKEGLENAASLLVDHWKAGQPQLPLSEAMKRTTYWQRYA
jgi:hypothetical protein